jgi:hypothetical protein
MDSYNMLTECVEYWGRDLLPEYIYVANRGLMDKTASFKGVHSLLEDVAYVVSLLQHPRTEEFGKKVRESFIDSINATIQATSDGSKGDTLPDKTREQLKKARKQLEETET